MRPLLTAFFALLCGTAPASAAPIEHVFVLVLENRSYSEVVGNPRLPTFNALIRQGALARNYTGVTHPSLPNYVAMIAGSTMQLEGDNPAQMFAGPTLALQLEDQRLSWKAYMQGLPKAASPVYFSGVYAKKHNPFMLNSDIAASPQRASKVVPLDQLQTDLQTGKVPSFSFVVPDLCHDLHGALTCLGRAKLDALGETFLKTWTDRIMHSPVWKPGTVLIVTFDEGEDAQGGGGRLPTVIVRPDGQPGVVSDLPYNHYSLLRTIEDRFGLPPLREAKNAAPMNDLWAP